VTAVEDAAAGFNARFSARSKTYRYVIDRAPVASPFSRAFAWHVPEPLDADAMHAGAAALAGTHDFAAFQSTGSETPGTVRTITRSEVTQRGDALLWRAGAGPAPSERSESKGSYLVYEIAGDGFLRHMVRAIVGTLVDIGRGWRSADSMRSLLAGADRHAAGATAPPHGLFLVSVDYD
jgi:tRNA pseudouridine38-40 synthase